MIVLIAIHVKGLYQGNNNCLVVNNMVIYTNEEFLFAVVSVRPP